MIVSSREIMSNFVLKTQPDSENWSYMNPSSGLQVLQQTNKQTNKQPNRQTNKQKQPNKHTNKNKQTQMGQKRAIKSGNILYLED